MVQGLVRLILLAVWLVGCATRPPEPPPELTMPAGDSLSGSPAASLVLKAETALERGEAADAGRLLERALGMVPDSSWLYRKLAELRLYEGDAAGAEGFTRRALRHAPRDNVYYRAALHELLATALARQGDTAAARQARRKAGELRTQ